MPMSFKANMEHFLRDTHPVQPPFLACLGSAMNSGRNSLKNRSSRPIASPGQAAAQVPKRKRIAESFEL